MNKTKGIYSSLTSYGDPGFSRYMRRAFLAACGYDRVDLDRPVIGITNTASDFNPCHQLVPRLIESIKRGVLEAGGLPLEFPTMSLHEVMFSPTTMLYRNLMAMEIEELLRAQPMDAIVMVGGCDKTVPAQLMAAASSPIPAVFAVVGPMITGSWRGERLGACTDCRRYWSEHRAGELDECEISQVEQSLCPGAGTCMVMGTASTMACITETLGLMPPGAATPPATSADRLRSGVESGRLAVSLAKAPVVPRDILTPDAIENALTMIAALGGSTNTIIHLAAIAGRVGYELSIDSIQKVFDRVPVLVDCKPIGSGYLEDFHQAGGVPVLLQELKPMLNLDVKTITHQSLDEQLGARDEFPDWQTTIRRIDEPLQPPGSMAMLRGSLAPYGAIIKSAAARKHLVRHRGPAVVFESPDDATMRIDDPSLKLTPDHVLVLRNAGPVASGMPEAGSLPIPKYLAAQGVRDMVRVTDGRMSGTAYGTVVLHCCPEAAVGGPIDLVEDGDTIELNLSKRSIDLLVEPKVLGKRRMHRKRTHQPELPARGWAKLFADHALQANQGVDLDFLTELVVSNRTS